MLLPIGSVVLLKGGERPLLIYGRKQTDASTGIEYDYLACLYPEGFINQDFTYLFNGEMIEKVLFTGYVNESEKELLVKIDEYLSRKND